MQHAQDFDNQRLDDALRALSSLLGKCEKAEAKLKRGSSQHTLLVHRIDALHVACALIRRELDA